MANSYKVLGQSAPAATTATALYTVPSSTDAVGSTLVVCNRGVATTFRIAVRPDGAALANQHYLIYDNVIEGNDSLFLSVGITINAGDVVEVYAGHANTSFTLFGTEITA